MLLEARLIAWHWRLTVLRLRMIGLALCAWTCLCRLELARLLVYLPAADSAKPDVCAVDWHYRNAETVGEIEPNASQRVSGKRMLSTRVRRWKSEAIHF